MEGYRWKDDIQTSRIMNVPRNNYMPVFATCEISFVLLALALYFVLKAGMVPSLLIALAGSGVLSLLHWIGLAWWRKKRSFPEKKGEEPA